MDSYENGRITISNITLIIDVINVATVGVVDSGLLAFRKKNGCHYFLGFLKKMVIRCISHHKNVV